MTLRDLINIVLHRLSVHLLRLRLLIQRRLKLLDDYQPDPFARRPVGNSPAVRNSFDRLDAFLPLLPDGPLSAMDIGCNEGFFVFRLAERGGMCIGIDQDRNAIMAAKARAVIHRRHNVLFAHYIIDQATAKGLPDVDVIICLSVFHHMVRHLGLPQAREIFAAIAAHAKSHLIFETGQPNEAEARWANELSFMGPNHRAWIREFLTELDFQHIEDVGDFATTVSATPRTLFVASRSRICAERRGSLHTVRSPTGH